VHGVTAIVAQAERRGGVRLPISSAGLRYRPHGEHRCATCALDRTLRERVRELSA
jgi:hypothetical protein